jgi:lysophospholipase L1-like esterase
MNETVQIALFLSILLNILFLALGSVFIAKRGGLNYLYSKFVFLQSAEFKIIPMYDTPYYQDKKSHYETLPQSNSDIIFLGDSLTDLCKWEEVFQNNQIKNRGICGDTTDGVLNRLDNIVESRPQKIFIMIGINDLNRGRSLSDIVNNYKLIFESFKHQIPQTKIFIQSLLPINSQKFQRNKVNDKIIELNEQLQRFAKELSFQYIDLFSAFLDNNNELDEQYTTDGLHLNGKGYLVWKEVIEKDVVD